MQIREKSLQSDWIVVIQDEISEEKRGGESTIETNSDAPGRSFRRRWVSKPRVLLSLIVGRSRGPRICDWNLRNRLQAFAKASPRRPEREAFVGPRIQKGNLPIEALRDALRKNTRRGEFESRGSPRQRDREREREKQEWEPDIDVETTVRWKQAIYHRIDRLSSNELNTVDVTCPGWDHLPGRNFKLHRVIRGLV